MTIAAATMTAATPPAIIQKMIQSTRAIVASDGRAAAFTVVPWI
jgi:hypothetical protein